MAEDRRGPVPAVDDVDAALPMYGTADDRGPDPRRGAAWMKAGVVVLFLVGTAGLATMPARSGATKDSTSTSTGVAPTTDPLSERTISAASPIDGKASKRLPVRLTPDKDLVDGQVVGIHGSGFTPGAQVGIVTCTNAAQREGSAACDLSGYALSTADPNGEVQGLFTIRRFIVVAGQNVDCLNGAIDPAAWEPLVVANGGRPPDYPQFTCIGVIGELDNYDNSGGWPMALSGAVFKPLDTVAGAEAAPAAPPSSPSTSSTSTSSIAPSPTTGLAPAPDDGWACPFPDPTFPGSPTPGSAPARVPRTTTTVSPPRVDCDPTNL